MATLSVVGLTMMTYFLSLLKSPLKKSYEKRESDRKATMINR